MDFFFVLWVILHEWSENSLLVSKKSQLGGHQDETSHIVIKRGPNYNKEWT